LSLREIKAAEAGRAQPFLVKSPSPVRCRKADPGPTQTVVVVDDDDALLEALRFGLELEGFNVRTHRSAGAVDAAMLPTANCCLVIDYKMPGMNGLELLGRLRRQAIDLPAIIITSHVKREILARCHALGAAVVEKPLLGDGLMTAIHDALNVHVAPVEPT
jgi:two-component system response regulator FixJ